MTAQKSAREEAYLAWWANFDGGDPEECFNAGFAACLRVVGERMPEKRPIENPQSRAGSYLEGLNNCADKTRALLAELSEAAP